jgi:hypothetical protein
MSDADGMGSDTQPAAECGSSDLDLRRLLKSSYTCTLSSTATKFVEKFCNGRSYSGSLALICLAALLMVRIGHSSSVVYNTNALAAETSQSNLTFDDVSLGRSSQP